MQNVIERCNYYTPTGSYPGNGEQFQGQLLMLLILDQNNYDTLTAYDLICRDSSLTLWNYLAGALKKFVKDENDIHNMDALLIRLCRRAQEKYGVKFYKRFDLNFFYSCRETFFPILSAGSISQNTIDTGRQALAAWLDKHK